MNPNTIGKVYRLEPPMLAGLAVAFLAPWLAALFVWMAPYAGIDPLQAVPAIRVATALAEIAALLLIVTYSEKRLLGSLGIRKPSLEDLQYGLGCAAILWILAIILPSAFRPSSGVAAPIGWHLLALYPAGIAFGGQGALLPAILTLAVVATAHELAMRGFAVSRLRTVAGSNLPGGIGALVFALAANLPLWGFAYTMEIAPIEALLVGLFLWKRRLLPCVVANFATCLLLMMSIAVSGSSAGSHASERRAPTTSKAASPQDRAVEKLDDALKSQWGPAAPFIGRANDYAQHGDYDKAIEDVGKAIAAEPKVPGLYVARGDLYSAQNHHAPAVDDYSTAISMVPDEARFYLRRANEYVKMDQDVAAHRDFAKAIDLAPENAMTYIDRSALYAREKRYDDALRDVDAALKLRPHVYDSLIRRGQILELMHRYDDAIAACDQIIALDSSRAEGYSCRAQEKMVKGDLPGAIADFGEVLKRAPDARSALVNRADLEIRTEQWTAARADAVALANLNTLDAETADWYAFPLATSVHPELRDGHTAVKLATRACEATNWRNVKYLETLAAAYAESGDFGQAIRIQQDALQIAHATDTSLEPFLRWQLTHRYQNGLPYREDDNGAVTTRSRSRYIFAIIATVMALIGFVTVAVAAGKFLWRTLRRRAIA